MADSVLHLVSGRSRTASADLLACVGLDVRMSVAGRSVLAVKPKDEDEDE